MFPQRPEIGHHHLLDKVMAPREAAGLAEGCVTRRPLRINLCRRSHTSRRLHVHHSRSKRILLDVQPCLGKKPRSFHIELVPRPVLFPLILLRKRDLQTTVLLGPLCHKGAIGKLILHFHAVNLCLLRQTLKFIVCAKSIQIRRSTVGLIGPAKFTQSEEAIRGQMINLKVKLLKHLAKELDGR